ncbi:MAG: hypothetical protein FWF59_11515 [Turicibacter sp.]|nr:hypothetical protein [Turicibacter sp.]
MADSVLSVRLEEQFKQKFLELAASNEVGNKEMLQMMLSHFELEQIKKEEIGFGSDLDELQRISKRISEIYLNLAERTKLRLMEAEKAGVDQMGALQIELEAKVKENGALKTRLEEAQKLETVLKEQMGHFQKASEELKMAKDLNNLLQQKNSHLEAIEKKAEASIGQREGLLKEIEALKAGLNEKEEQLERQSYQIGVLQEEKAQKHQEHSRALLEREKSFKDQLTLKEREFQLELKEVRLTLQIEQAAGLEALKGHYEEKMQIMAGGIEVPKK